MRSGIHSSILKLTLMGFTLVMVPLVIALISTLLQINQLAAETHLTVNESAQAVESSRILMAQVLSMGRSAGQYQILHDKNLLKRYENQRMQLYEAQQRLATLSQEPYLQEHLSRLKPIENNLYKKLLQINTENSVPLNNLNELDELAELVRPIPMFVTQLITSRSNAINNRVTSAQTKLMWQVLGLAPLAVTLAIVFSVLITRPLRHLSKAIYQLGSGDFAQPVTVKGPHDIQQLGHQLDWLRRRLASLDEQKMLFLRHVSHELKTPLTAIREGVELLQEKIVGPLNTDQAEVTQILKDSSQQLQNHVEALLSFNLSLAEEKYTQYELIDMTCLIPQVLEKYKLALRSRNLRVKMQLEKAGLTAAYEQIKTILDNLISNAIKYSECGGEILINLTTNSHLMHIDIIDNGVGIELNDQAHIFEPFFQGSQLPYGHIKGTGLGLAIAQRYVNLHHGKLELLPGSGGSHFQLTLPMEQTGLRHDS